MPTLDSLLLFAAASAVLVITPGPATLFVAAQSAGGGRTAGVASALGIATGAALQVVLVAVGLAALLAEVPVLYAVVRYAGAAALIAMGALSLATSGRASGARAAPKGSGSWRFRSYPQGVLISVLNPQTALFLLAFLPQFVDVARGDPLGQVLLLGLVFDLMGLIVNLSIAVAASLAVRQLAGSRAQHLLPKVAAAVLIVLGVSMAVQG